MRALIHRNADEFRFMTNYLKTTLAIALAVATVSFGAFAAGGAASDKQPLLANTTLMLSTLSVGPRTAALGASRILFVTACSGAPVIDESQLSSGRLIVRIAPSFIFCGAPELNVAYVPKSAGALKVQLVDEANNLLYEASMDTVAPSRSLLNVDGMWADPATNGSGVAVHHAAASDTAFGTWFLFDALPAGGTRWLSFQGTSWINGGRTLVGLAYEVGGNALVACPVGDDCPRPAANARPVGYLAMQPLEPGKAFIEAYDRYGRVAFTSRLDKLQF
jgi:hypothetical protein